MDAVAKLVAWRLDLAHVDPAGLFTFVSGGSERFRTGVPVLLRAVSGHRDTGFTTCPGDAFYGRLNELAVQAAQTGLPKIFEPRAESVEGLIRVRARLSSAAAWTVAITDTAGLEVARGTGTGTAVDWTWDPAAAASGSYRWTVRSGTARPATGPLRVTGGTTSLAIQSLTALPAAITPNGDGQGDTAAVSYRLTAAANVTVELHGLERRGRGDRRRPRVDAGRDAHREDRRNRARRRPLQRRRPGSNRRRRGGREHRPAGGYARGRSRRGHAGRCSRRTATARTTPSMSASR